MTSNKFKIVFSLVFSLFTFDLMGCQCPEVDESLFKKMWENSDFVLLITPIERPLSSRMLRKKIPIMEYGNDVLAKTEKVFKGNNISETTFIAQEWNSCDESFYFGEKYLVFGNVLKNATYPLSVSAERILQAKTLAEYAKKIGAKSVAHGSTGAGNDQVRFDMIFQTIIPDIEIITPIRDLKLSREEEIAYLKKHGISMNFEKAKYSINKGIWGTSVGGKETLTSNQTLPEEAWPTQVSKTGSEELVIGFDHPLSDSEDAHRTLVAMLKAMPQT